MDNLKKDLRETADTAEAEKEITAASASSRTFRPY